MDTSQQPRDENKITHKNSLFLSWCILLALCFAFVSAAPAAAGPNPAKYDKAIRDMGQLQKSKKRLQREPWEKLAETFLTVYRVEKKMERALSGLVPLRRSAGSFGPLRLQYQGRPALGGPVSPARPPLSQKLAGRRQPVPGGTAAGPDPPRQGRSARTAPTDPQKNTLLPIRPRTPPVTLRRSRPKKNGNRLPPPARQASKNSLEANRSVSA